MKLKKKITKDFSTTPAGELYDSPVYALHGISDRNALSLYKAFNVDTIEDLAHLKYFQWAREICSLADSGAETIDEEYFSEKLIKKYRKLSPAELADSPLSALYGLSRKNTKLLNKSLNLHTIRDLSTLKYITWARSIDYKHRLIRDYEEKPLDVVANAPVHAMQGISNKKTKIIEAKLNIHTIKDLAEYKYGIIAHKICRFEKTPDEYNPIEYESNFTAQYKDKSLKQILRSPVTAFRGLGKAEASALSDALGVKNIKNLGSQKYIVWARDIIDLYNAEKKLTASSQEKPAKKSILKPAAAIIFLIIAIIAGFAIFMYNKTTPGESSKTTLSTDLSESQKSTDNEKTSEIPGSIHESQENDYIKYRIQEGDTLVIISRKMYGTYERWPEIYRLNRDIIDHPARIFPGHTINLPTK